jgi:predicted DNA-binding protein
MTYNAVVRKATRTTSLRFTPEARRLLEALAAKLGISMAAVIEIAIRHLADRERVQ